LFAVLAGVDVVHLLCLIVGFVAFVSAVFVVWARICWWWWRYAVAKAATFASIVVYKGHGPQQTRCVASTCMFSGACNVVVV
jgi:hypothetical protein